LLVESSGVRDSTGKSLRGTPSRGGKWITKRCKTIRKNALGRSGKNLKSIDAPSSGR